MSGGRREKDRPRSGSIRVTWAQCPNAECASRDWAVWNVDFHESVFTCGTCDHRLMPAIFVSQESFKRLMCPLCQKNRVLPPS